MSAQAPSADTLSLPMEPGARIMRGPSAWGGGARRFLHLTWIIAVNEFRLSYFGSALGYLWSLARPALQFGVLYLVFSHIVRFGDEIPNYPMLLLLNIVLFNFFTEATTAAVRSVQNRETLVRKMHFPRMVIPLSVVLTAAMNLAVSLVPVLVFLVIYGIEPGWTWLLLPVALLAILSVTLGVSLLLSALFVRFRDVAPIWTVAALMLFYGSPVLWAIELVPESVRQAIMANPLAASLELARVWIIDPSAPGPGDVLGWPLGLVPIALTVLLLGVGAWVFHREAPGIAERL